MQQFTINIIEGRQPMKDIKTIKHDEGAWVIFANQTPGECAKRARQVMRSLMFGDELPLPLKRNRDREDRNMRDGPAS